jgi:hypothetical protein
LNDRDYLTRHRSPTKPISGQGWNGSHITDGRVLKQKTDYLLVEFLLLYIYLR